MYWYTVVKMACICTISLVLVSLGLGLFDWKYWLVLACIIGVEVNEFIYATRKEQKRCIKTIEDTFAKHLEEK